TGPSSTVPCQQGGESGIRCCASPYPAVAGRHALTTGLRSRRPARRAEPKPTRRGSSLGGRAGNVITSVLVLPSLSSVTKDFTLSSLLPANAPSVQTANLAAVFQNTCLASATIVASRTQGALTTADQTAIDDLEAQVQALPQVIAVHDVATSPDGVARQAL